MYVHMPGWPECWVQGGVYFVQQSRSDKNAGALLEREVRSWWLVVFTPCVGRVGDVRHSDSRERKINVSVLKIRHVAI